jgi:hypothetical protein
VTAPADPPRVPDRDRPVGRIARSRPAGEDPVDDLAWSAIPGRRLVEASWVGTFVLAVAVGAGLVALDSVAPAVVATSAALFVGGSVMFFVGYARAVERSRHELLGIGGIYFMAGSTPRRVRRHMMASLVIEVVLVIVAVSVKPFSSLVFTSLAPMWGLGCAGAWAATHGTFPAKAGGAVADSGRSIGQNAGLDEEEA